MTRLRPVLLLDYLRNVVFPRAALAAALTVLANAIIFASIVLE